jgi:hypothetical protein
LVRIEISPVSDRRESGELENEVAEPKKGKGEPDALIPADATKPVSEGLPQGIKKHHQGISGAEPEQRIDSRHVLPHLSEKKTWSDGVRE